MTTTESEILTEETVPKYLTEHASDIGIFPSTSTITAKAILGGNVNYAFYVSDETGEHSVFVKQAPEFVAIFGPDGLPLTSDRMRREIEVYEEWKIILGEELRAKYLPSIYKFDSKFCVSLSTGFVFLNRSGIFSYMMIRHSLIRFSFFYAHNRSLFKTHRVAYSKRTSNHY